MNERTTQKLVYCAVALIALTFGIAIAHTPQTQEVSETPSTINLFADEKVAPPSCNVAVVKIQGGITTYNDVSTDTSDPSIIDTSGWVDSEHVVAQIEAADASSSIDAIVVQIDSTGGSPVAAEEIAGALRRVHKSTVALIRGEGLSAAYWAATGADTIFAAENAEVGSIGVTSSYVDQVKHNTQIGYTFHSISTGEYKDMLNSNKTLTKGEEALVREEIGVMFNNFVNTVSRNRGIAVASITPALTSGAPFIASYALEHKLIDHIGDKESVRDYLAEKLHKAKSGVIYCK